MRPRLNRRCKRGNPGVLARLSEPRKESAFTARCSWRRSTRMGVEAGPAAPLQTAGMASAKVRARRANGAVNSFVESDAGLPACEANG